MDSTVPADLLKLKDRLEAWRATRKYARQPIPEEFRQAAAEMTARYSPSLVRRVLKLDPWREKKSATKKPSRVRNLPQTSFFTLPPEATFTEHGPSVPPLLTAGCRLLAALLRPLPFRDADRLVELWETRQDRGIDRASFTEANFWDVRAANQTRRGGS